MKAFATILLSIITFTSLIHAAPKSTFTEIAATREILKKLKSGGYVLYMRHGATDTSRTDRAPQVDLNDCSTQRPLTPEGLKMAAHVGDSISKAKIPISEIFSSPLCRAKESAQAAFGSNFKVIDQLMYTANMTTEEKKPNVAATRRLLATPVEKGRHNRVVVSHAPNLADLIGYFPKEGTVVILKPRDNGHFEYIASIAPDAWSKLLNP